MGLRIFITCLLLLSPGLLRAEVPNIPKMPETAPATGAEQVTPYTVVKKKDFPNYKVEIEQRMTLSKFPRVESMKAREQKQTNDLAKMERLRALRLAKEAADKVTADQQAVEAAQAKRETVAAKAKVARAKPAAKKPTE